MADPGTKSMPRELLEQAYSGAYDAWEIARESVHTAWQKLTDPNNLQAPVTAAFSDAADLVVKHGEFLGDEIQSLTLARLRSVPVRRVSNAMRQVLNSEEAFKLKIQSIINLLDSEGVVSAPDPKPLPAVSTSEVRLVTWMAVSKRA
jgi:uncharacterized protein with von Willebrand factor type A (vWA) domain